MPLLKSSHLLSKKISSGLVKNRKYLMWALFLLSLLLFVPLSQVRIDTSGVAFNGAETQGYIDYQYFVDAFGTNDYILLAVKNSLFATDPQLKKRINGVNGALSAMPSVLQVIDLGTVQSSSLFNLMGLSHFWEAKNFDQLRPVVPGLSRLISNDMKTIVFIVKIDNEVLNGFQLEKQLKQIIGEAFESVIIVSYQAPY